MQNSNINPSIKYIESSQIHSNDIGSKNIQVYEITLLNTPIFICVGNFNTDIDNDDDDLGGGMMIPATNPI